LPRDPAHLFNANIFFPERQTLAYSDALIAPAIVTAPLFWLHISPVLIYNLALAAGFLLSGLAMYGLVRDVTGSTAAAIAAGAFFMCAPFRFDHYVHLELQLTFCMPLALWSLHRLLRTHHWRAAAALGGSLALQTFCSVYYGVFLGTLIGVVAVTFLVIQRDGPLARRLLLLGAAALFAGIAVAPYLHSYLVARDTVGTRDLAEVLYYSAKPLDYLTSRSDNWLYGNMLPFSGGEERHLFPGFLIVLTAALSLWRPTRTTVVYLIALAFTFDASLGLHGHVFPILRATLLPYEGLRVPARFAMLVVLTLSMLAGLGLARLTARWPRWGRALLVGVICVVSAAEGRTTIELTKPPLTPSALDVWLAAQPRSPLLELPLPSPEQRFDIVEGRHIYDSIFHWQPLVNGISGFWPKSYLELLERTRTFPDADSLAYLISRRVHYVIMRPSYFTHDRYVEVRDALMTRPELKLVAHFPAGADEALVFSLRD
jgi:hypothetical protein